MKRPCCDMIIARVSVKNFASFIHRYFISIAFTYVSMIEAMPTAKRGTKTKFGKKRLP